MSQWGVLRAQWDVLGGVCHAGGTAGDGARG